MCTTQILERAVQVSTGTAFSQRTRSLHNDWHFQSGCSSSSRTAFRCYHSNNPPLLPAYSSTARSRCRHGDSSAIAECKATVQNSVKISGSPPSPLRGFNWLLITRLTKATILAQRVTKSVALYVTLKLVTALKKRYWSLSWTRLINPAFSVPAYLRSCFVLSHIYS